jgi:hypothetical protein
MIVMPGTVVVILSDGSTERWEAGGVYDQAEFEFSFQVDGDALRVFKNVRYWHEGSEVTNHWGFWGDWEPSEVGYYRPRQWNRVRVD